MFEELRFTFENVDELLLPFCTRVIDANVLCSSGTGLFYAVLHHPDAVQKEKVDPVQTITRVTNKEMNLQHFGWLVPLIVNGNPTCCLFHRRCTEPGVMLPVCFHGPQCLYHGHMFNESHYLQCGLQFTLNRLEKLLNGETLSVSFAKKSFDMSLGCSIGNTNHNTTIETNVEVNPGGSGKKLEEEEHREEGERE